MRAMRIKKLLSLLTAIVLAVCIFPCVAFAEADISSVDSTSNTAEEMHVIFDPFENLKEDDISTINYALDVFTENTDIFTCIAITDNIGEEKTPEAAKDYAEKLMTVYGGTKEHALLLFLNNDTGDDYIIGKGKGQYYSQTTDFTDELVETWKSSRDSSTYVECALIFVAVADGQKYDMEQWWETVSQNGGEIPTTEESPIENEFTDITASANPADNSNNSDNLKKSDSGADLTGEVISSPNGMAYIVDKNHHLTLDERNNLISQMEDYNDHTNLNMVISVCDDVGSDKSDSGVVDFADLMYEQYCGKNTDGILLLINNDTLYDYVSTSGAGINYYSDYRLEKIFDGIYDDLKDENYYYAASGFVSLAYHYFDAGKANNQTEILGSEFDPNTSIDVLLVAGFICLVIGIIIYIANANSYKLQRPNNSFYIVKGSMLFQQATDTFLGPITTRVYSPRSSSSGGGGGHSGHSSTHHSSSGGRHGGGGRHR